MYSDSVPSSSTWQWQAEYGLFYWPARNLWAQYDQQTGQYTYLPSDESNKSDERPSADASLSKEDGELSDQEDEVVTSQAHPARPSSSSLTGGPAPEYDDPALYAFPSINSARPATTTTSTSSSHSTLRLVLVRSSCLPPTQTIALLSSLQPDGYTIGRDKQLSAEEGRIRLREMEVSKSHAIVYHTDDASSGAGAPYVDRDGDDAESGREWDRGKVRPGTVKWWVVDSGSVHGTFVKKAKERKEVDDGRGGLAYDGQDRPSKADKKKSKEDKGKRLSEPKTASLPFQIEHGDLLTVGTSAFEVHLHARDLPCTYCTLPSTSFLIPTSLAPTPSPSEPSSPPPDAASGWDAILAREHGPVRPLLNPKEKLKQLKAEMLARPSPSASTEAAGEYRDRAALRRLAYPDEPVPSPHSNHHHAKKRKTTATATVALPTTYTAKPPTTTSISSAPTTYAALPTTNKGHSLLMKHGWTPGTSLGSDGAGGRVEPIEVKRLAGEGRKGLGVKQAAKPDLPPGTDTGDWRDQGKERRWREMNGR